MDTIRELFYGNIHPYERDIPQKSEGDKLNKLIIRHDAALKATLNEQEVEILETLKDVLTEQSSLCECEDFVNGFRLCQVNCRSILSQKIIFARQHHECCWAMFFILLSQILLAL